MNAEESAQDTTVSFNDVGNGHSPAEYLLKKTWKQLKASTKAVKMSLYLCTVFDAQANAYERAAKKPRVEMRSTYMERGDALGVLADALKQSPVLEMHVSSNEMLAALVQVEPVQKILDKAASYVAAAQKEQDEEE